MEDSQQQEQVGMAERLEATMPPTFSSQAQTAAPFPNHDSFVTTTSIAVDPVALITQECITITSAMRKHARWAQSSVSAILGGGASRLQNKELLRSSSQRRGSKGPVILDPGMARLNVPNSPGDEDDNSSLASRWGLRGRKGKSMADNPLLTAFARLRRDLAGCRDVSTVDAPELLHPFLQVIRSSSTSAAITSLAVISITKFFAYNIITIRSPRISQAMHLLSAAITHCRFEASDTAADEVVLLRILRLMESIISRPEGQLLGDESICEMMSTGLSMCCQARLSEVLRRSAEMAMVTMCQVVFGRLRALKVEEIPKSRSRSNTRTTLTSGMEDLKIEPPMSGSVMGNGVAARLSVDEGARSSTDASVETKVEPQNTTAPIAEDDFEHVEPYSLPSIKELFRVLIDLLDPHDKTHTDAMRIMALRIIDVALEVAGPSIARQPVLGALVQDDLCRHLFQLVRSDNMVLLNSSLRVAGTLLATCRQLLKLQQELFLSYLVACLHPRVDIPQEPGIDPSLYEGVPQAPKLVKPAPSQPSSGRSTPVPVKDRQKLGLEGGARRPEAREAMVESIGTLVRMPSFMVELFINYDCEVDRQDLCEDMVGLLSRNAFPDSATWSTTNVPPLCLDSLLSFVQFIAERINQEVPEWGEGRIQQMQLRRARKKIIKSGATKFNDDPKLGVAYLVKNGIIQNPDDPVQVAQFLKGTSYLSKKVLGDFLTKKNNEALLIAFIDQFDFADKRIDEALRELLGSFRLPGEAPLIARIVTTFSEKYITAAQPEEIADKDAAFVLTYAIIMLNTDQYNPNVAKTQKRMTPEEFAKNLRGVNAEKDFQPEFLQEIYEAIKQNEIILPDEHENKHAFEYAWKELLLKTQDAGSLELCETNAFDAEMFRSTWKPIIATLCYVFMSASDDAVYSRVVVGFNQCALIAAKYNLTEVFDRIVYSVSHISGLASEIPPSTSLNTEVQVGKRKIMVSEMAVRLGRDFRAQLSTVLLFRILEGHENAVGDTWIYIVRILRNLFVNSLITLPRIEQSRLEHLDSIPLQPPSQVIDRDGKLSESGIFSTFTSYLSSYAADDPPEPSEEELENTLSSVDCIKACHPDTIIEHMFSLSPSQTKELVGALLSQLEDSSPVVTVKPERPIPVTVRVNGHRMPKAGPEYDPGTVFLLELATLLATRDQETVAVAGEQLTNVLENAVRDASNLHPLAASRVVHYLLELLRYSYVSNATIVMKITANLTQTHDYMRAPVVLHAISSFDDTILDRTAPTIVSGLTRALSGSSELRNEITKSPDFWSTLQRLHQHKTEAENVFDILTFLCSHNSPDPALTAENFELAISSANDFAAAGSIGSIQEKRRDFAAKQGRKAKDATTENQVVVSRALKAIGLIYNLTERVPNLIEHSHLERGEAWAAYWSPIFRALCSQSVNPCREVRHRAVSALQRTLLSETVADNDQPSRAQKNGSTTETEEIKPHTEWTAIFDEVLFPLVLRLLKPEVYQSDAQGMNETRTIMGGLLCKVFLRYVDRLHDIPLPTSEHNGGDASSDNAEANESSEKTATRFVGTKMQETYLKTLTLLDRLMNSGTIPVPSSITQNNNSRPGSSMGSQQDALSEAVREGVKNTLLVMDGAGYLDRHTGGGKSVNNPAIEKGGVRGEREIQMWPETVRRLERFLPGLIEEIFPEPEVGPQLVEKGKDDVGESKEQKGDENERPVPAQ
jgi:golgi-specific brefeldin A-resistance guanine nucleotide exchange factor 1